jgi:predicted Zn finger-like uncharacterized protein
MLITTCTHCLARFRVTPQQLNAKQGQVRCGRCRKVFSGFEALERYPDDDTGSRLLAAREATLRETHPAEASESVPLEEPESFQAEVHAPVAPAQKPAAAPPASAPVAPAAQGPASKPLEVKPRRSGPTVYEVERAPSKRSARAWVFGAGLLAIVLMVEAVFAARSTLAHRYPVLRPWLESACGAFRCTVPWPNNEALLKLEDSELLEVPGKANQIALGARIRNLAPHAQEYPHVELTLTDLTGQAAARRVIRPSEYLGRPVAAGEILAPSSEVSIYLRLETPAIKATGYELMLFYP